MLFLIGSSFNTRGLLRNMLLLVHNLPNIDFDLGLLSLLGLSEPIFANLWILLLFKPILQHSLWKRYFAQVVLITDRIWHLLPLKSVCSSRWMTKIVVCMSTLRIYGHRHQTALRFYPSSNPLLILIIIGMVGWHLRVVIHFVRALISLVLNLLVLLFSDRVMLDVHEKSLSAIVRTLQWKLLSNSATLLLSLFKVLLVQILSQFGAWNCILLIIDCAVRFLSVCKMEFAWVNIDLCTFTNYLWNILLCYSSRLV